MLLVHFPCCHCSIFCLFAGPHPAGICSIGGRTRRREEQDIGFWTRPPPPQLPSVEPCPRPGAATYLAPCAITPVVQNQKPPKNRRSLIPTRRPSTSPRLPRRMAAHSPQLSKPLACRGKEEDVARGPNEGFVISHCYPISAFHCHPTWRHSDVGMCRICHEGGGGETLLSPCDCTGTLGKVHKSCLEKWLSSSNTSYCELCHTEFTIERRPQPLTQVGVFSEP